MDIEYFSFNEKRAEEGWKNFPEDIKVLRSVFHEQHKLHSEINKERRKIFDLVDPVYQEKLHQKRLEIFKSFSDRNYFLPGTTTWEYTEVNYLSQSIDEVAKARHEVEIMYLLLRYGTVYPGGIKDGINWEFLDVKSANEYLQIEDEMKLEIERQERENPILSRHVLENEVPLHSRQDALRQKCNLENLIYNDLPDDSLFFEMAKIDLYYGSVQNDFFEENKVASMIMEHLLHSGDELLNIYGPSIKENIAILAKVINAEYGWDEDESVSCVLDFLKCMKPIAKDLKENPDSVLVSSLGGDDTFEPIMANEILTKRALEKIKKYKGVLPPIL